MKVTLSPSICLSTVILNYLTPLTVISVINLLKWHFVVLVGYLKHIYHCSHFPFVVHFIFTYYSLALCGCVCAPHPRLVAIILPLDIRPSYSSTLATTKLLFYVTTTFSLPLLLLFVFFLCVRGRAVTLELCRFAGLVPSLSHSFLSVSLSSHLFISLLCLLVIHLLWLCLF